MDPKRLLRFEGVVVLVLALIAFFDLDDPLWLLAVLALAPDLSMLGYRAGPRFGSRCYNAVHTYALPLALGAVGHWGGHRLALLVALIWAGHIGADRGFGYGLKFESGFRDTHLSPARPPGRSTPAGE